MSMKLEFCAHIWFQSFLNLIICRFTLTESCCSTTTCCEFYRMKSVNSFTFRFWDCMEIRCKKIFNRSTMNQMGRRNCWLIYLIIFRVSFSVHLFSVCISRFNVNSFFWPAYFGFIYTLKNVVLSDRRSL